MGEDRSSESDEEDGEEGEEENQQDESGEDGEANDTAESDKTSSEAEASAEELLYLWPLKISRTAPQSLTT